MPKPDLSKIKRALYIKLGEGGGWARHCFEDGTVRLGYHTVPNGITSKEAIAEHFRNRDTPDRDTPDGAATNHARQVADFLNADIKTLWITFCDGYLWWAVATRKIEFLGSDLRGFPLGSRLKRTVNGWSNKTIAGKPLIQSQLSGKLTKSASYRGTICSLASEVFDYLLYKIRDEDHPTVREAQAAKAKTLRSIEKLVAMLTPKDFELFVDLLFASGGWRRIDDLGGTKKTVDIEMMLPLTNERAYVQIKSATNQREFNCYADAMAAMPADRIFYVYHTAKGPLSVDDKCVTLMGPQQLAESALRSGLLDWLIEKVG